jgi:SanA protein
VLRKLTKMVLRFGFYAFVFLIACLIIARAITGIYASEKIYTQDDAPNQRVAIVFGAGLRWDGAPTAILRDRMETAADLYRSGRVEKLLLSGDNRYIDYNEPLAMKTYALELGIPEIDLVLDYAGRRTYDTCYRARDIFGVKKALLVTQDFHLPRALFTCNSLGIDAFGVKAANRTYRTASLLYWNIREFAASLVALWDLWVGKPVPVLGDPEPIFPPASSALQVDSGNDGSNHLGGDR